MSHNLNIENGVASLVTAKEVPWHKLGTILPECFDSITALKLGGLDFPVKKYPLHTRVKGVRIPVENHFATVREDNNTPLGIVGNYYTVLQNTEAFEFFDSITGEGEAIYESAGCLGKGETIFLTAKLPDYIQVTKDVVNMYLVLTNSHDGSRPVTAFFTPIKTVCQNTLNAGLKTAVNKVVIKHTANVKQYLQQANELMHIKNLYVEELRQAFAFMEKRVMTDLEVKNNARLVLLSPAELKAVANGEELGTRKENMILEVMNYYESSPTLDGIRGTAFGAYNAITGYLQNIREYKSDDVKMQSLVLPGAAFQMQQKAFELLVR